MRRIPRSSRSIDPSIPSSHLFRPRISPSPCRAVVALKPLLRTTSAPFSTSSPYAFLALKQDKKKHKASIRKWQKRLLGDSEPIGSRVDPYDPTSPIRISPEETGEEQEVLDEVLTVEEHGQVLEYYPYEEAESGEGLERVGGKQWIKQKEEYELAERFEKLLQEPYPWSDGLEEFVERPRHLTQYTFGPRTKITELSSLRDKFHQAVVEIHSLKWAKMSLDLSSYPNRGKYGELPWNFNEVTFSLSRHSSPLLRFPTPEGHTQLLEKIQSAPETQPQEETDPLMEVVEELVVEEPVKTAENKEAKAPVVRVGALVKQTEGKPFDFMSNRPVPRVVKPKEEPTPAQVVETAEKAQPVGELDVASKAEKSREAVAGIRQTILEAAAQKSEQEVVTLREQVRGTTISLATESNNVVEPILGTKYRDIPLASNKVKFALSKRLLQLTGLRISDPNLNASHTLGDLYGHLVAASKPKPKKLYDIVKLESELRKKKKKPGMEQLSTLPNVQMYPQKITEMDKDKQVGRWKVIEYALAERNLPILAKEA